MYRVQKPGLYPDIKEADYHSDPCPSPSFTQSIAKTLLTQSPKHAWFDHPRLNTRWTADDDPKYDVGNTAHTLLLGRGKEIVTVDAPDWRSKAAREERERLQGLGKVVILEKVLDRASQMVAAARTQIAENNIEWNDPEDGVVGEHSEAMLCAVDDGKWMRSKVDRLTDAYVLDYKTTQASASPEALDRRMVEDGWDIQAAMHARLIALLSQAGPDVTDASGGLRRHIFLAQESYPPFALSAVEIGEGAMTIGTQKLDKAWAIWKKCLAANDWPSYTTRLVPLRYPDWARASWEATMMSEEWARSTA